VDDGWHLFFPHRPQNVGEILFLNNGKTLDAICHPVLLWRILNFLLSSIELCRTVAWKSLNEEALRLCRWAWYLKIWQKFVICSVCHLSLEEWSFVWGIRLLKPLHMATGLELCSGTKTFLILFRMTKSYTSYRFMTFQGNTHSVITAGGRGV